MKNSIHYSPEAQNDLDEIWEYITFELCNPQAAENTVNKIMDTVDELENFSEIGAPLSSVTDIESDYRFLTSGNYMVWIYVNMDLCQYFRQKKSKGYAAFGPMSILWTQKVESSC